VTSGGMFIVTAAFVILIVEASLVRTSMGRWLWFAVHGYSGHVGCRRELNADETKESKCNDGVSYLMCERLLNMIVSTAVG